MTGTGTALAVTARAHPRGWMGPCSSPWITLGQRPCPPSCGTPQRTGGTPRHTAGSALLGSAHIRPRRRRRCWRTGCRSGSQTGYPWPSTGPPSCRCQRSPGGLGCSGCGRSHLGLAGRRWHSVRTPERTGGMPRYRSCTVRARDSPLPVVVCAMFLVSIQPPRGIWRFCLGTGTPDQNPTHPPYRPMSQAVSRLI